MPAPKSSFVQRLIRWRFLLVINLFVIVLVGMSLGREVVRSRSIGEEISSLQAEAEALAARNIEISEIKSAMQTESYIEREARLKLGMKKPGETVVVIQEEAATREGDIVDPADPLGLIITETTDTSVANPTRWWYYFFNKSHYNALSKYE